MNPWLTLFVFIIGTFIGSFINVFSLRYNSGLSPYRGRSKCFSCSNTLEWYDMIPVFSFFALRGKCRSCKSKISVHYPIIELITGLFFVGILQRQYSLWPIYSGFDHGMLYSVLFFLFYAFIFGLLMVIVIYDIRHKVIPDPLVYLFIALSSIKLVLFFYTKNFSLDPQDFLDLIAPFALFTPFALLWFFSGGRWIGFGDAKLAIGIGALVGFVLGISSVVLSFWIGALFAFYLIISGHMYKGRHRKVHLNTEIPFAPFMVMGVLIVFLSHIDVLGLQSILDILH